MTANDRSSDARGNCVKPRRSANPAAWTIASTLPNAARAARTSSDAVPASARSPVDHATLAPARSQSAATAFKRVSPAASAPCPCNIRHSSGAANRRAIAAPIPDPPPVMIETRMDPFLNAFDRANYRCRNCKCQQSQRPREQSQRLQRSSATDASRRRSRQCHPMSVGSKPRSDGRFDPGIKRHRMRISTIWRKTENC